MIRLLALVAVLALAACGVEGPPKVPAPKTGVSVTGEVAVGVSGQI
jgi:predicted small lipoprotein YifL